MRRTKSKRTGRKPGRRVGTPNRVTTDVREAFVSLMQLNAANFAGWLATVANGQRSRYRGSDRKLHEFYVVKPDPAKALEIMISMAEYHIPKLARTEHAGGIDHSVTVHATPVDERL